MARWKEERGAQEKVILGAAGIRKQGNLLCLKPCKQLQLPGFNFMYASMRSIKDIALKKTNGVIHSVS